MVCLIIPTALVGCRVTVAWRCTPLCSTKRIPSVCTSRSQPVAFTGPTMADVRGRRKIEASALCSCPTSIPSSGNVYTRLRCILPVPNVFTCKIIGACIAPMTMPKTGRTLPIYFGTRSGQIFGSRDEGRTWERILDGLPSVVCIRNAVVEDASGKSGPKSPKQSRAISFPTKSATTRKSRPTKKG